MMKHIDPFHTPPPKSSPVHNKQRSLLKPAAIALLMIASMGYGMTALYNPGGKDVVSASAKQQLIDNFTRLDTVKLEPVAKDDVKEALDSMRLQPTQRRQLERQLAAGAESRNDPSNTAASVQPDKGATLAWLTLWDFASQDGDIVKLSSAGYEASIPLLKSPTRIAVPIDAAGMVEIEGSVDGGGGITLGVMSAASPTSLPVLRVGEKLSLPVSL